jgi:hypothetical protein
MPRIIYGVLAGVAATVAMTAAMRRLHRHLPAADQYPVPPREIVQGVTGSDSPAGRADEGESSYLTMIAHFAYGGATGALFALQGDRAPLTGIGYGVGVWAASYLGWIPAARILVPATRHPMERNVMMIAAHAVWGAVLAAGLREIEEAERSAFRHRGRKLRDLAANPPAPVWKQ